MYKSEESYFYYQATHQLILNLISKNLKINKNSEILDAGCGTGLLAKKMTKLGKVTGVDIQKEAINFSEKRGVKVIKSSLNKLPFKDNLFDLIVCVDVIYHRRVDDGKALSELFRVLKPGGILILRVPAYNFLKRSSDIQVHTRERYTSPMLSKKLIKAGFKIEKMSYIHIPLLLLAIIQKLGESIFQLKNPTSSLQEINPMLNKFILSLLVVEVKLVQRINLPFGLGLLAVSKKL